ncbi:WecB/TagA/CpsF family glycosyltransferase [Ferroacidibacillus organovorans]|uniref:N-acetylglucosaminyldiphosphoundecaprenol N-acetyl-beta-D-mannosaminyltransferase n=1 Tax=Ferroacidibacillus organovorans TaxID=1765683 RepID=A0A117SXN2_9BACL|nr:WecB/TagA/CpsF family glycosyltransferase [Ferroacidibacillus organovorans]KUO95718.1 hypothetical protein ATW55_13285 [Ferroacidibacillus organovorans]
MKQPDGTVLRILNVPFATYTENEVIARCTDYAMDQNPHVVITAGPEFVMHTRRDQALLPLLEGADLITPDGIGIVLAARLHGHSDLERVTGVTLAEKLLAQSAERGFRVFLLGASPESNAKALNAVRASYPELAVAGRNGYFDAADVPMILDEIRAFHPQILLVGLGQPRQERFIWEYRDALSVPLMIGVGGTIDILAGTVKRAPVLFQRMHLEWFYRLLADPKRWRRQLALPQFAYLAYQERLRKGS